MTLHLSNMSVLRDVSIFTFEGKRKAFDIDKTRKR